MRASTAASGGPLPLLADGVNVVAAPRVCILTASGGGVAATASNRWAELRVHEYCPRDCSAVLARSQALSVHAVKYGSDSTHPMGMASGKAIKYG